MEKQAVKKIAKTITKIISYYLLLARYYLSNSNYSKKGFIKLTKRALVSYLIFSTVFVGSGLIFLFNPFTGGPKKAEAAWFNDNWSYRKTLSFTHNATVSSATKVKFDIDTTAAPDSFQADCGDVRFTSPNGDILPYYYDSGNGACDTNSTDFYVLIPTIINGSNYIYMYYGNPTVSNGTRASQFSESTTSPSGGAASAGSEEKAPSPVSYWKFDDGQGTTAEDSSSNNKDATLAASTATPTWQTENMCMAGKCLLFDGSDDYVSVASPNLPTGDFTYSAWIKVTSTTAETIFMAADGSGGNEFVIEVLAGKLNVLTNGAVRFTSTGSISTNNWYFITVTRSGSSIQGYINGLPDTASAGSDGVALSFSTCSLFIGVDVDSGCSGGLTEYFNGFIDEPKIYNQALTAAQIKANYNARSNPEGVSTALGANTQNMPGALSNGLVGYWKMDENTGTSAADSSGNGNTGTLEDGGTWATGKFGSAVDADGTNSAIDVGTAINSSSEVTTATWYKSDGTGSGGAQTIMFNGSSNANQNYVFEVNRTANVLSVFWGDTLILTGTTNVATANWTHVAMVRSGSSGNWTAKLYVNGVLEASTTTSTNPNSGASPRTCFGNLDCNGTGTNQLGGLIDDTRIYHRALSGAEIAQLYNWAPGPSIYLKMDDGTGTTTAIDSSGNGKNGTLGSSTQAPAWSTGKYGKALNYDGSDDYATVASPSLPTTDFTFETWFFANAVDNRVMAAADGSSSAQEFGIQYDFFGRIVIITNNTARITTSALSQGAWHHVAATRNGSTITVYLDGVAYSTTATDSTAFSFSTCPLLIGALNGDATQCSTANTYTDFWNGKFDEVKVYNYARTPGQVVEDMNAGHPAPGSPISSAVAHWKFDEGYSTTAGDYTGNSNSLTLSSASSTWTNNGKFNKAFVPGGAAWATRSDDDDFDFASTDDMSVSFWFKSTSTTNPSAGAAEYLFKKGTITSGGTVGYAIYGNSSGNINFGIRSTSGNWGASSPGTPSPEDVATSTTDLYDTNWHHIVAKKTGTSRIDLYVDGLLNASDTSLTASATLANSVSLFVGDDDADATNSFAGTLDEMKVYRSALTDDQVKMDMNRSSSQVLGAIGASSDAQPQSAANEYCPPDSSASVCTGPVGEWKFDEKTGQTINDISGNGNTGTLGWDSSSSTDDANWTNGKYNGGLNFDGSSDCVNVGTASLGAGGGAISVSAWVNPSLVDSSEHAIVRKQTNIWNLIITTGNKFRFEITASGTTSVTGTTTPVVGTWYHVMGTYDGATLAIYVNGKLENSTSKTGTLGASSVQTTIGSNNNGSSCNQHFFGGKIDQVRVYNYGRNAAQVSWEYNKGGPIAHWKMDECQGTTLNDYSGNSKTGTLTNATAGTCQSSGAWFNGVTGKRNYSISLDGSDDYITGSDATFPSSTTNRTISAWIKTSSNTDQTIFSYGTATDNNQFYLAIYNLGGGGGGNCNNASTGGNRALIMGSGGSGGFNVCDNKSIIDGNWHHVVGTINSSTASLYIDGQLRATYGSAAPSTTLGGTFRIGNALNASVLFNGQIDDTRVYNYSLTATQVKQLYNDGAINYTPVTGAP